MSAVPARLMADKNCKSEAEWRNSTPQQYHVTRQKGTEPPGTGEYEDVEEPGTYLCICCGSHYSVRKRNFIRSWMVSFLRRSMKPKSEIDRDISHGDKHVKEVICSLLRRAPRPQCFPVRPAPNRPASSQTSIPPPSIGREGRTTHKPLHGLLVSHFPFPIAPKSGPAHSSCVRKFVAGLLLFAAGGLAGTGETPCNCEGHQAVVLLAEKHINPDAWRWPKKILADGPIASETQSGTWKKKAAPILGRRLHLARRKIAPLRPEHRRGITSTSRAERRFEPTLEKSCDPKPSCMTHAIKDQTPAILRSPEADPQKRGDYIVSDSFSSATCISLCMLYNQ